MNEQVKNNIMEYKQKYLQKLGGCMSTREMIVAYITTVLDTALLLIKYPHQYCQLISYTFID